MTYLVVKEEVSVVAQCPVNGLGGLGGRHAAATGSGGGGGGVERLLRVGCFLQQAAGREKRNDTKMTITTKRSLFVGWLLNVQATCQCISGTGLLRQFYVLPR